MRHEVLDETIAADLDRLTALRRTGGVVVLDMWSRQQDEANALLQEKHTGGRWVYYPWRNLLVHLLEPSAYRRVRLDRNRNKLTAEEQERFRSLRIGVVGLSVGHAIAHLITAEGLAGELRLADPDVIDLSNLNRIPASVADLGANKAEVAARRIAELDPYLATRTYTSGVTEDNIGQFMEGLDLVVEECDSIDMKFRVREEARRRRIPVFMATSDRGMFDVERFDLEAERHIFHGLAGELNTSMLKGLTSEQKVPFALQILEPDSISARLGASMVEINRTIFTWPQLGGDVALGAATVVAAIRRMKSARGLPSGRLRLDIEESLDSLAGPSLSPEEVRVDDPAEASPQNLAIDRLIQSRSAVVRLAEAAHLAPSAGNGQPWLFRLREQVLDFFLNQRNVSTLDVKHRGSYVALGAALFNAKTAASALGCLGEVELAPQNGTFTGLQNSAKKVASLHLGYGSDPQLSHLFKSVQTRSTNRHKGNGTPLSADLLSRLMSAARSEGGVLHLRTTPDSIAAIADILAESDRIRILSPILHHEMMNELNWTNHPSRTGIDIDCLALDFTDRIKLQILRRRDILSSLASWSAGQALGDMTRSLVRSSAAIGVITSPLPQKMSTEDEAAAYLQAGMAMEAVWLTAQDAGIAIQPVSPIFLYAHHQREQETLVSEQYITSLLDQSRSFRSLFGLSSEDRLAITLRFSFSPSPSRQGRRKRIEECIVTSQESDIVSNQR
jgi:molybdopterin/thiamine biosynthesis adenylyltransferase